METVPENSIPGLSDSVVKIREDVKSGVENLTEECVSTMAAVTRLLMKLLPKALNCLPDAPQNQLHSLCFLISSSLNSAMDVRRSKPSYIGETCSLRTLRSISTSFTTSFDRLTSFGNIRFDREVRSKGLGYLKCLGDRNPVFLHLWNEILVMLCVIATLLDPLFCYTLLVD
ncbi:cyclic nucleotide-gated ion channel 1-like isoform X1 [Cucumis melo]|uniref:Cyclic nucleotide-gated ion channel 1-like isoform X1 n=1 Tax=Cucumis melo TaxID=3656 RepID=A0ABM3KG28_CUCME|nr:cyclic nucleotide-gated ion channel 1-like isoform X1 [Cucumis melo]XP_050936663.1 cyclic nucleotide-gated ion channel 1-like isoform X1 [Cucumis melo]XP_050936731.1 cyclic nucleotide-gated ion channel 1-like isoform X1 [Cucumis melo]XP_050936732.1 cyclic nucleotide-gated ion channel 1-like isoform X2 [Cucumis melo]XP_050947351.1 cyclic nucleotide-gated ion channel 1-like isoform X1 [Cucumis melo]XP_050947356.1 cyclic nucleotide-gated ion channel 1-like isoform X1 [Cucumis melo]XP_05094738